MGILYSVACTRDVTPLVLSLRAVEVKEWPRDRVPLAPAPAPVPTPPTEEGIEDLSPAHHSKAMANQRRSERQHTATSYISLSVVSLCTEPASSDADRGGRGGALGVVPATTALAPEVARAGPEAASATAWAIAPAMESAVAATAPGVQDASAASAAPAPEVRGGVELGEGGVEPPAPVDRAWAMAVMAAQCLRVNWASRLCLLPS